MILVLIGGGCLLMALVGAINTAVDGGWVLWVSGADVELPNTYEACAGLVAVGASIIGLTMFGDSPETLAKRHQKTATLAVLTGASD